VIYEELLNLKPGTICFIKYPYAINELSMLYDACITIIEVSQTSKKVPLYAQVKFLTTKNLIVDLLLEPEELFFLDEDIQKKSTSTK